VLKNERAERNVWYVYVWKRARVNH
jgi:hypothetical protein